MEARMLKKGLAVAVILLFIGVAVAPNINADVNKPIIDTPIEDVAPTPIVLALQLMTKLRNHKDIQNVETEDDVLQIIESDKELNSIVEQLSGNDCDCEDDTTPFEWPYPIICFVFGFPLILLALLAMAAGQAWVGALVGIFGELFNCFWY